MTDIFRADLADGTIVAAPTLPKFLQLLCTIGIVPIAGQASVSVEAPAPVKPAAVATKAAATPPTAPAAAASTTTPTPFVGPTYADLRAVVTKLGVADRGAVAPIVAEFGVASFKVWENDDTAGPKIAAAVAKVQAKLDELALAAV